MEVFGNDGNSDTKTKVLCILAGLFVILAAFFSGYLCGIRNAGNVPGDGGGTAAVGKQLDAAATNQRQLDASIGRAAEQSRGLANSLDRSAEAVDRSKAAADSIAGGIDKSQELVEDAGRILRESQQILRDVRQRGESKTAPH